MSPKNVLASQAPSVRRGTQKRKLHTIVPPSFKIQGLPKTYQYFIAVLGSLRSLMIKFCFKVWLSLLSLGMQTARGSEVFKTAIAHERLLITGLKKTQIAVGVI
jgi:hypothetical protein